MVTHGEAHCIPGYPPVHSVRAVNQINLKPGGPQYGDGLVNVIPYPLVVTHALHHTLSRSPASCCCRFIVS